MTDQNSAIVSEFGNSNMQLTFGNYHSQTSDFSLIGYDAIRDMMRKPFDLTQYKPDANNKLRQAKANCPWFLPSSVGTSKTKQAAESHNQYTALIADIDTGNSELEDVETDLRNNGIECFYIYSTVSSKPTDKRWRVVVPISEVIDADHWQALQAALVVALDADDCTSRTQQISYAPALSFYNQKCYQIRIADGEPLDVFNSWFAEQAALLAQDQAKEAEELEAKTKAAQRKSISLTSGQLSPIDEFNKSTDWNALLSQYGYKKRGKKWLHPDSTSGIAGVIVSYRDDVNGRYVSSHSSDPLCDGFSHDKFDLYCQFEHSGDTGEALKRLGAELMTENGLSVTHHNQQAHNQQSVTSSNSTPAELTWRDPLPFDVELHPVNKFDPELLPDQLKNYVVDYAKRMDNAPADFAAISVVICAGALIGGAAEIQPKKLDTGWRLVPTMWGGAVGQPSTKKTPSLGCGRKLLEHAQKSVIDKLNAEKLDLYEIEKELAEDLEQAANEKAKEALAAGDKKRALEIKRQVKNQIPELPKLRSVVINDSTSEALAVRLEKNPLGVLMFRDELSSWLANMDRADRQHERGFYLEGFNGFGSYSQERITRKNIELERVVLSVMGGIQPAKLTPLLAGKVKGTTDDGLLERIMQIMVYPDFSGMEYVDQAPNVMAEMAAKSTFEALAYLGERDTPLLCKFEAQAQELWEEWAKNMLKREKSATAQWQSMLGKYPALCAKLALVFHLLEECGRTLAGEKPEPHDVITIDHLRRAIKWMDYLESHAQRIMTFFEAERALAPAKTLLDKLPQLSPTFTRHAISQKDWKGLTSKESREEAIAGLMERGYIQEVTKQPEKGRPTVQFYVHPSFQS
ncbi:MULTISPECIES: YfjI family protein [Vibrio harveyi group]|uniref:YfjI family protein n=1 Tax=Vibrio harveyi group TaxID=717610 RepID=UPI00211A9285|nr:YfjI family protein [Vibrio alginolyticus]MCQ9071184.1 DUF3987 domain-containing protein [Vibrio alginolyticus]